MGMIFDEKGCFANERGFEHFGDGLYVVVENVRWSQIDFGEDDEEGQRESDGDS